MNGKLRRMLKEIYASEQPDKYPEFIYQIQKERNRRKLRYAAPATALVMIAFIGGYSYMNMYRIDDHNCDPVKVVEVPETETSTETTSTAESTYTTESAAETTVQETETSETTIQTTVTEVQTTATTTITTIQIETVRELPAEQIPTEITTTAEIIVCEDTETQAETITETKSSVNVDLAALDALQDAFFDLQYEILEADNEHRAGSSGFYLEAEEDITELEEHYRDNGNLCYERYKRVDEELIETNFGYPEGVYVGSNAGWTMSKLAYEDFMNELIDDLKEMLPVEEFQKLQVSQQNFLEKQQEMNQRILEEFPHAYYPWINEEQIVRYRVLLLMEYFE